MQTPLYVYLKDSRKNDKNKITWTLDAEAAFASAKADMANAALLAYPSATVEIRLVNDASDFAMGAVLEQKHAKTWKPLSFF